MKVNTAEFILGAMGPEQYPQDALPEIALAGRSNVGKSSLINRLLQRKSLARTSSTPGKTQQLNYYLINAAFYFVDFPGYGFARVSKTLRERWGKLIEEYLLNRETLKLVVLIIDIRHPPTKDDVAMYEWLRHYEVPVCVVATKADKIARGRWQHHFKIVKQTLQLAPTDSIVLFSSESGVGKDQLWSVIQSYMQRDREVDIDETGSANKEHPLDAANEQTGAHSVSD